MKTFIVTTLFFQLLYSCNSKQIRESRDIYITNKSSSSIDSVIIPLQQNVYDPIKIGETKKIMVEMSKDYGEGKNQLFIYIGKRIMPASWGLHDWGQFSEEEDRLYVFDNGVSSEDKKILKPQSLTVYLVNKTSETVDSVKTVNNGTLTMIKRPSFVEITANYDSLKRHPYLNIYQKGKTFLMQVDHDWQNWNFNEEIFYLYTNGEVSKKERQ